MMVSGKATQKQMPALQTDIRKQEELRVWKELIFSHSGQGYSSLTGIFMICTATRGVRNNYSHPLPPS